METEPVPLNLKYQLASMSGIVRAQVTPRSAGGDEGAGACVIPGLLAPSPSGAYPYIYQKE